MSRLRSLGLGVRPFAPPVIPRVLAGLFLLSFVAAVSAPRGSSPLYEDSDTVAADLILENGKILTLDDSDRTAEAVAIRNNRFVAVGATSAIQQFAGENTRIVDLGGRTVLPGLVDAHSHTTGVSPDYLDLTETHSVAEIVSAVEQEAAQTPPSEWIIGAGPFMFWRGWDEQRLKEKRLLTRWDLDPVSPNHPVLLMKEAGHALVLNSYALRLAGINKETPDHSGQVVKDAHTGEPTGILLESSMNLAFRALPAPTPKDRLVAARHASDQLLRMGTTTVANMSVGPQDVRLFQKLYTDTSQAHVSTALCPLAPTTLPVEEALEFLRRWPVMTGFGDSNLKIGALKIFVDGGITGRAAWFKKPYRDHPGFYGIPQLEEKTLFEVVRLADQLGWQVHLHVCGDAAVDLALRALEAAQETNRTTGRRHILTHLYVVSPAMMERMRQLGVVAVLQPNFVYSLGQHMQEALDTDQLEHLIPFRSLLEAGVPVALSADGLPQNPMHGIYAAVARSSENGAVLGQTEAVTRKEAIRAYTRTSAYALFEEVDHGSIERGKLADLIVLDRDIMTVPVEEIKNIQVLMTIKHGRVVFSHLD